MRNVSSIVLQSCPKRWSQDLDKSVSPEETCKQVNEILKNIDLDIVSEVRRIDTGRLGIPVYLSVCGSDARQIMPTRKQMGKGSSSAQAKASALMELMERFAFFSFWNRQEQFQYLSWSEARKLFGDRLIPIEDIILSVQDSIPPSVAENLLDLHKWAFFPATRLNDEEIVWLPLDWFRMLGEFNGSSAGNSPEESILQGICELVERHVCCLAEKGKKILPTINAEDSDDSKLGELLQAFQKNGINIILKDFSLEMPLPTVAALAWDPSTFPEKSEIVFTAGTASSPEKAAIRAVTEIAQLAGDFHTNACYEASGLSKYYSLDDCAWIFQGPKITLKDMPSAADSDIREEIRNFLDEVSPVYAIDISHPLLKIPAHYCIAPGFRFRERANNQSVGLFTARKLVEDKALKEALEGLDQISTHIPDAPWLPFFRGLAYLNNNSPEQSLPFFMESIPLQDGGEEKALAEFYAAYALTQIGDWSAAIPLLDSAVAHCAEVKEYFNLLGVANFKTRQYAQAERAFNQALKLDKGSAMDLANRGICRKLQGKTREAEKDLKTALEIDPSLDFAAAHLAELQSHE